MWLAAQGLHAFKPGSQNGIRTAACVIYYLAWGRDILQLAYDSFPPTAPFEARGPSPAGRFCPGCDSIRRRPAYQSKTPNHFGHGRPAESETVAVTGRFRRSRISDAIRARARHG